MIAALDRKLLRDLAKMKAQALAIVLVASCGVAIFLMSVCTLLSMQDARARYYRQSRFADVFTHVKRAPLALGPRIAEIPGVAAADLRIVVEVNLDIPGIPEPASGRLISLPDLAPQRLNVIHLRTGRLPEPGRAGEVVASEAFAAASGLKAGDRVRAIINGRLQELRLVGIGLSPEYIYQIRPGELMPDDRRFGIFWMREQALAEAFDMEGAFNDAAIALLPGASRQGVIDRLDALLDRYGSIGAYGREDQVSHKYVSDELRQLTAMALMPPSIFLGVTAFLVNMVLSRTVRTQREQIAALRAFGYRTLDIALHYIKLVLILAALGAALGIAVGWALGSDMTRMYARFFRFPDFRFILDGRVVAGGVALSAGLSVLGALGAVRHAASLAPAEAMRPEPPPPYRPSILERLGLRRLFSGPERMILRKLGSHPVRAAMTSLGIALGVAVLILGHFSLDAITEMIDFEFQRTQRQSMTVTLVEPASARAAFEFERLPGVLRAEPFRAVPVRLRSANITRRVAIQGIEPEGRLLRVLDRAGRPVPIPASGLLLSDKLARILGVSAGDALTVEVLEGRRETLVLPVNGIVRGYVGTAAYMSRAALNAALQEGPSVSGAYLAVDPARERALSAELKETPRVAGVTLKRASIESFWRTVAENLLKMRTVNVTFAVVIACGVVYNAARITLAERARELASMRVLGFTRAEVSYVLLGELGVLVLAGIPVGLLLGTGLAWTIISVLDTESYTIPLVIAPATYAYAVAVVLAAALASGLAVRRSVDHLDLIGVLKNA